jgi:hypothetical protein
MPLELPGARGQLRYFVAKRVGTETLSPVPFHHLGVPRINGLVEPISFVPGQMEH